MYFYIRLVLLDDGARFEVSFMARDPDGVGAENVIHQEVVESPNPVAQVTHTELGNTMHTDVGTTFNFTKEYMVVYSI